ncbi:MetQ/NlpA family ABC transporter substrate-binding protein [Alteribacter populi]|uniref:MetQ/NlpA family ABC transporter substrate-binding protein n=1 Tax=Alteribacter populi TaxID=2011011 RepID=UPI000BBAE995|nr:MetQ/NlpA family ABC transporter substrate-binding protein [Alteribacter populi]
MEKRQGLLSVITLLFILLTACNESSSAGDAPEEKEIVFGATVPYTEMLEWAVKPSLEEKGYDVTVMEFSDYVQPNNALDEGSLDANLFQHEVYLTAFSEEANLDLSLVIPVPTAPIGIYSNKYESLTDIEDGSSVGIANDPTNLSRGLTVLRDAGLIEISDDADPIRASTADITDNPKNLQFHEIEAGQLPRSLESLDLAAVNGNFAIAAGMDLTKALALDNLPPEIQNQVVVNTEDLDEQFVNDIKEVIRSGEFEKVIDNDFQGFKKPGWMAEE